MNKPEELISFDRQDGKGGSSATATWNATHTQVEFSGAWCKVPPLATPDGKRPPQRSIYAWILNHAGQIDAITAATLNANQG